MDEFRILEIDNVLSMIEKSVNILWDAVQEGKYGSRSLIGDETLNMAEALREIGRGPLIDG